jgi:ubiquitin carboxyl-terminal hydrolase 14
MPTISLKHGAKPLSVEVPTGVTPVALKAAIAAQTGVPPERQKLMSRAWRGVLRDDATLGALDAGLVVTLMGSADAVAKPVDAPVFVEDLTRAEVSKLGAVAMPAGLANEGNTC